MVKVDPSVLKRLRITKGLSQDELAEKTKFEGQPKLDKQTISRLERGDQPNPRFRTIQQLARALNVDPAVLTGEATAPEVPHEDSFFDSRSQLNIRVGTGPRNALSLVARRYRVDPSQIVELAPLLFVWAAEESLRQRGNRITKFEGALVEAEGIGKELSHLSPHIVNFAYSDEAVSAERESIDARDLFGTSIEERLVDPQLNEGETENPFAIFLHKLIDPLGDVAKFEEWSGSWTPRYQVCPDEAAALVGGDRDRADEILNGLVPLNEMPKEIRKADMVKERAEWVRSKAEEYGKQLSELLSDLA